MDKVVRTTRLCSHILNVPRIGFTEQRRFQVPFPQESAALKHLIEVHYEEEIDKVNWPQYRYLKTEFSSVRSSPAHMDYFKSSYLAGVWYNFTYNATLHLPPLTFFKRLKAF